MHQELIALIQRITKHPSGIDEQFSGVSCPCCEQSFHDRIYTHDLIKPSDPSHIIRKECMTCFYISEWSIHQTINPQLITLKKKTSIPLFVVTA
jgi:hypothetical protein